MTYTNKWEEDWKISDQDYQLSNKLLPILEDYLVSLKEKGVSKTTFNRHKAACHALGGFIINDVFNYQRNSFPEDETGKGILLHYIDTEGGPLIHHDEETWQRELDAACKKFYKFLIA